MDACTTQRFESTQSQDVRCLPLTCNALVGALRSPEATSGLIERLLDFRFPPVRCERKARRHVLRLFDPEVMRNGWVAGGEEVRETFDTRLVSRLSRRREALVSCVSEMGVVLPVAPPMVKTCQRSPKQRSCT